MKKFALLVLALVTLGPFEASALTTVSSYYTTGKNAFIQPYYADGELAQITSKDEAIVEPFHYAVPWYRETLKYTASEFEGYAFDHWFLFDASRSSLPQEESKGFGSTEFDDNPLSLTAYTSCTNRPSNILLIPCYRMRRYALVYRANDGTTTAWEDPIRHGYTNTATLAEAPWTRPGYAFTGWSTTATGSDRRQPGSTVTGYELKVGTKTSTTLYATWTKVDLPIILHPGEEATVNPSSVVTRINEKYTLPTPTREAYDFVGWRTEPTGGRTIRSGETVTDVSITDLYAEWQLRRVTISVGSAHPRGGRVSPCADRQVEIGSEFSFSASPASGFVFTGWSDGSTATPRMIIATTNAVYWANFTSVTNSTDRGDAAPQPSAQPSTVYFLANGGRNKMAPMTFAPGVTRPLHRNAFTNTTAFLGWATKPDATKDDIVYLDEASLSDPAPGGYLALYAVWEPAPPDDPGPGTDPEDPPGDDPDPGPGTDPEDPPGDDPDPGPGTDPEDPPGGDPDPGPGTDPEDPPGDDPDPGPGTDPDPEDPQPPEPQPVTLTSESEDWSYDEATDTWTNDSYDLDFDLIGTVEGSGTLTFEWCGYSFGSSGLSKDNIEFLTNGVIVARRNSNGDWQTMTNEVVAGSTEKTTNSWHRLAKGYKSAVRNVRWTPAGSVSTNATSELKLARAMPIFKGTGPIAEGTDPSARGTGPVAAGTGPVAAGTGPVAAFEPERTAYWHVYDGLVYDGNVKTGVVAVAGCSVTTAYSGTTAGTYEAEVALEPGWEWPDGTTETYRMVTWSIGKAVPDLSGVSLTDATVIEDGSPKSLLVAGKLPTGVSVSYTGNGQTKPGTYTVKAVFTANDNFAPMRALSATLRIVPLFGFDGTVEPVLDDTLPPQALSSFDVTVPYDGRPHTIDTNALLQAFAPYAFKPVMLTFAPENSSAWDKKPLTQTEVGSRHIRYCIATESRGKFIHEARVTVSPRNIRDAQIAAIGARTWTGLPQKPVPEVKLGGQSLGDADFTVKYANNVAVGTASVTITGIGNFTGQVVKTFAITRATYDLSGVTFPSRTIVADGSPKNLTIVGTLPDGVSVTYVGNGQVRPGVYTVTANFTGNAATHQAIASKTATLTLIEKPDPRPQPPQGIDVLYPTNDVEPCDASANATFTGWLCDAAGAITGLITVKTTIARSGKPMKSTITVTGYPDGKRKTYKATVNPTDNEGYPTDEYGLVYSDRAILGTFKGQTVITSKDFAASKRPADKALAATLPQGSWSVVFETPEGYVLLSVTTDKKGKAKITGTLANGTKVTISAQGVLGEDGRFAIPVVSTKKTSTLAFILWRQADGTLSAPIPPAGWTFVAGAPFSLTLAGEYRLVGMPEVVNGRRYLMDVPVAESGETVALPDLPFTIAKGKLSVPRANGKPKLARDGTLALTFNARQPITNVSALKLRLTAKTGIVTGSFKAYYIDASGRLKSDTVTVNGMVIGERVFASGTVKKLGVFALESEPLP